MIAYVRRTPIGREYLCSVETNVLDFTHPTIAVREREIKSERKKPIWKCCTSLRTYQWKRKRYF